MATKTPETPAAPEPHDDESEPIVATIDETGPVEPVAPANQVAVVEDARVVEADEPIAEPAPAASAPHVVYVTVPAAPVKKGNRGLGSLFAVLAAGVYAVLLAIVFTIIWFSVGASSPLAVIFNATFFIPVLFFAAALVLLVLVLNRAGWWTYVIGSVVVALAVYFGAAGSLLLLNGGLLETPESAAAIFRSILGNPLVIAAALLAREVAIWAGILIAYRGRKVKARNAEARATWDREQAERNHAAA